MSGTAPLAVRRALPADLAAVEAVQQAAYGPMAKLSGRAPLPLRADYAEIMAQSETWVVPGDAGFDAALILQHDRASDPPSTLVWSVAVAPRGQSRGLGRRLLDFAETRAAAVGSTLMRLYTNEKFARNLEIYRRFGYAEVRRERHGDEEPPWIVVHMEKPLSAD